MRRGRCGRRAALRAQRAQRHQRRLPKPPETLRDANDKLRDWGTENEEALETLREEHADLVREHEALTQKAEDEESRADSLQEELDSLQKVLWAHALPSELAAALRQAGFGPPGEQLELLPSPPPEANSAVVLDPAA